ncbi:hypothetical protein STW0522KLE44_38510 [Klebsiella sp. STW0522-44]|nr:hypothetical protein STW0522KLE44_38510 [Klebsiella sp. STW0522-44]
MSDISSPLFVISNINVRLLYKSKSNFSLYRAMKGMRVRFVVHDAIMQNTYNLSSRIVLSNDVGGSSHFSFLVFVLQIHYEYGIIK